MFVPVHIVFADERRVKSVILTRVESESGSDLPHIAKALSGKASILHSGDRRNGKRSQRGDDGDHNEQFNKRETGETATDRTPMAAKETSGGFPIVLRLH